MKKHKTKYTRHGYSKHSLYKVWKGVKSRCLCPGATRYENYGGRGLSVCDEWMDDPVAFIEWCKSNGWKKGMCIDRIDSDKGYTPENCRIADHSVNSANQHIRKDNTSGYRGVSFRRRKDRGCAWIARVQYKGFRKQFQRQTPELAAEARDQYVRENNLPHGLCYLKESL